MSNYVWHRVICRKEILDLYFIDTDPLGDGTPVEQPYISFNKLFGVKSLNEYSEKYGVHISYGYGCSWAIQPDGSCDIKFCTRWQYPIRAIIRALELSHDIVWFAVEENHIYASKFYWNNGVKEDVMFIEDGKPAWDGICTKCFACIHLCPQKAIQFEESTMGFPLSTRGCGRYKNPNIKVSELMHEQK